MLESQYCIASSADKLTLIIHMGVVNNVLIIFASHSELSNNCIDFFGNTPFGNILEFNKEEYKEALKANITPHKERPRNQLTAQFPIHFTS